VGVSEDVINERLESQREIRSNLHEPFLDEISDIQGHLINLGVIELFNVS